MGKTARVAALLLSSVIAATGITQIVGAVTTTTARYVYERQVVSDQAPLVRAGDVVVDTVGNMYVTTQAGIVKMNPAGELLWASSVTAPSMPAKRMTSLALDASNNVYVTAETGAMMYKLNADGTLLDSWSIQPTGSLTYTPFFSATHIISGNEVWVLDSGNNRIDVYSTSGTFLRQVSVTNSLTKANGFEPLAGGDIAIVGNGSNQLIIQNEAGQTQAAYAFPPGYDGLTAREVAVDGAGNFYVTFEFATEGRPQIVKYSSSGALLGTVVPVGSQNGEAATILGMTFDSANMMYIAEYGNGRVQKLTTDGNFVAAFGTEGTSDGHFLTPNRMAFDNNDNLYVLDLY